MKRNAQDQFFWALKERISFNTVNLTSKSTKIGLRVPKYVTFVHITDHRFCKSLSFSWTLQIIPYNL